jgi:hypothetical protein
VSSLEVLLAEREIYRQLVRFARAMDARDWTALENITCPDIKADVGAGQLLGREAFVANMRSFLDDCGPTQHLLGNVLFEVTGDTASSQAYVSDMHLGTGDMADQTFRTLGDYHDRWQKRGDSWLMVERIKHNHGLIGSMQVLGPGPEGFSSE